MQNRLYSQSGTCIPDQVDNDGTSNWSEECYLNDDCLEQGNPCQANDVTMLGAYIADINGGPITTFIPGTTINFALWGAFYNNTGTNRYAVRSRTEFYKDGLLFEEANDCSFDMMPSGTSNAILLDGFSFQSEEVVQLLNTWVGWSTSAAQCTDPSGAEYKSECGEYPPAKCSKELGFIQILAPNFSHACGNTTATTVEVCFTNMSSGGTGPLVYNWDFGDGNTSADENPCHVYQVTEGLFTCLLEVTDDKGVVAAAQSIIDLQGLGCCTLTYECPPGFEGIMHCVEEIPQAAPEAIEVVESCGPVSITYLEELVGSGCPGAPLTLTRTYLISDDVSTASCTQSYTIADLVQPVLTCPADITVSCATDVPDPDITQVIPEENCDGATIVTFIGDVISSQTCENEFIITRTYQAEDDCGNISTCSQLITVSDNLLPEMVCPSDITVACTSDVPVADISTVIATDNCGGGIIVTVAADILSNQSCANAYTITRTYTAIDNCGNSATCQQTITVMDTIPPTITCAADITVTCADEVPQADVSAVLTADNCEGSVAITVSADIITNMTCTNEYTITRIYTAMDLCGNSATCAQTITVIDTIPPSITCPANATVSCSGEIPEPDINAIVAVDNCGTGVTVTVAADAITDLTCDNSYTVSRIYTATDLCGNISTCVQVITVDDIIPPSITCLADMTVSCTDNVPEADVAAIVTEDNCDGEIVVSVAPDIISGLSCTNEYIITRIYTATDACGNTSSCTQSITVNDITSPSIVCPADLTVSCTEDVPAPNTAAVITDDGCGGTVAVTVAPDLITGLSCANSYLIERTYTATDLCGNTAVCTQNIIIDDSTAPDIACLPDITVSCEADVPVADISDIIATDNCGGEVTITVEADIISETECSDTYVITRIYVATDVCGNEVSCVQIITVDDDIAPSITCLPDITVSCADDVPLPDINDIISNDNCEGEATVTVEGDVIIDQACDNQYTIERTYEATDACGNISECVQSITVMDDVAPVIDCLADITVSCIADVPEADISLIAVTDNCAGDVGVLVLEDVITEQTCANSFIIQRTYIAADVCGNTSACTQSIVVLDDVAPAITCAANVSVSCTADVPIVNINSVTATDNCDGTVTVAHISDVIQNQTCENNYTIVRTYSATDACSNSSICTQTITVADSIPPVLTCPPSINVSCAADVPLPDPASVTFTDNCGGSVTVTHSGDVISNQTCENQFTITRTYTGVDECGNSTSCTQTIQVNDSIAPAIALTDPLIAGLSDGDTLFVQCFGQDPEWDVPDFSEASVSAADNCGTAVTVDHTSALIGEGDCAADGFIVMYSHVWTAEDACGNNTSTTIYVTLRDTIAPVIVGVPEDVTVNWDSIPALPELFATDECLCACVILLEETPLDSSACLNGQVITRTWKATDACGNMAIETQNITIIDNDAPEMLMMEPELAGITDGAILEFTCAQGGIPSYFNFMGMESMLPVDGSGPVEVSFNQNLVEPVNCEFSGFLEEQSYSWAALDQCGNAASMTITARLIDNVAPQFVGLPEVACVADPLLNEVDAVDDCSEVAMRYFEEQVDSPCSEGLVTMRTYEAVDECGNMITDTVLLFQDDQARPILEFINPVLMDYQSGEVLIVNCSAHNGQHSPFGINDVSVRDACSENVNVVFNENMISPEDCERTGSMGLMELEWIATDVCGNATSVTVMAQLVDNTAPTFVDLEKEITISCTAQMPVVNALDNCGPINVITIDSIIPGDCAYEYDVIRTLIATDGCNNTTIEKQMVHVGDNSGPDISGVELFVCDDLSMPEATAFDPCAGVFVPLSMTQDTLESVCRDGMIIERTWTAIDACQNVAQITQQIIMGDSIAPEILVPSHSIIYDYMDLDFIPEIMMSQDDIMSKLDELDDSSVSVVDDCDEDIIPVFTMVSTPMSDDEGRFERRTYTWMATDHCGNQSSVDFIVDIIDDTPPVLELPGDTVVICSPLPPAPEMLLQDTSETVQYTELIENGPNPGEFIVTRTWIVTDAAGNSSVTVQKIKWIPDTFIECEIILPASVECNTHGVIISGNVTGGYEPYMYLWEIEGEECFIQSGQSTPEITIYIGWSDVNIKLTVTDAYGCVTTCTAVLSCDATLNGFVFNPVSIPNTENNNSVDLDNVLDKEQILNPQVWPNPADGDVSLTFESTDNQPLEISLINFIGQKVFTESITPNKGHNKRVIDASTLPEGSYLMHVKTKGGVHSEVLIIMRDK